jgi:hypothetical protein
VKIAAVILLIIAVIAAGLFLFKDSIARSAVQGMFEKITGAPLEIKSLRLSLSKSTVDASGITVYTPPEFADRVMASLPAFLLDIDIGAYFKGTVHIRRLTLELATLEVVRNNKAQVNIESLKALQPKGGGKPPQMSIDTAQVYVGTVVYRDYTLGTPLVKEFKVVARQTYTRVDDPHALVNSIIATALHNTDIARSLGLSGLQEKAGKELEKLKNRYGIPFPQ